THQLRSRLSRNRPTGGSSCIHVKTCHIDSSRSRHCEIPKDCTDTDVESVSDFGRGQSSCAQRSRPWGLRFGSTFDPTTIDASTFGHSDPCGLSLAPIFLLDFCQAKQYAGHQTAHRPPEINLRRNDHYLHAPFTPVG